MNWIKRYKRQNTKGYAGVKKILREDKTILKWKLQYLFKKHVEYPLKNVLLK
jgi:hypothetical protein